MTGKKKIIQILITSIIFLTIPFASTLAIEYFSIGGKPANPDPAIPNSDSWFIYNLDLGESKEDEIIVINTFDEELDLLVYAADGLRSSGGGFAVKQYIEPKEHVGSWVRFYPLPIPETFLPLFEELEESILEICSLDLQDEDIWDNEIFQEKPEQEDIELLEEWCEGEEEVRLTIPSKDREQISFIITIPDTASVGEHTGGIMIQRVRAQEDISEQGITLTTRVGVRIYQTVPGDIIRDIKINSFTFNKLYREFEFERIFNRDLPPEEIMITTEIANSGNTSVNFTENIVITQEFPRKETTVIEDRKFQVLRDDEFESNYSWYNPRLGKFTIQNNISYTDIDDTEITISTERITIWIIPWREIVFAGGILSVLLSILFIIKIINKKKYSGKGWGEYTVQVGETLQDLSERFDVDWKKLAKTNNIKPPYILKPGETILVPKKE